MNKVITINLNGVAYQLEEGGYDALRAYLDHAARRLEGNPDKEEIIADIEQAIADKFRALLGTAKTVVNAKEVAGVIEEMGPVETASGDEAASGATGASAKTDAAAGSAKTSTDATTDASGIRRLYRIYPEGAMLSGVCNGLGAYFGLDPTLFRIAFVLLCLAWGTGAVAYVLMVVLIPLAKTSAEKAAASGMAFTAQEFIKRARDGYYEGMRSFHDKASRREWKRKFRQDMRGWKHGVRQQARANSWRNWSEYWTHGWQPNWNQRPVPVFGPVFIAPLLSILLFALLLVLVYAIYSLVTMNAVFGLVLPAGMPLWVGILLAVVVYQLVAWPIKALRYSCYFPGNYGGHCGPFGGLLGSLVGLFFLGFGIWSLDRHVPEFHEWLVQLPDLMHRLVTTVQGWFAQK